MVLAGDSQISNSSSSFISSFSAQPKLRSTEKYFTVKLYAYVTLQVFHMRVSVHLFLLQQMDDAVYTFEQLLHQSLEGHEDEDLCKTIQRCQDRVIKVGQTRMSVCQSRSVQELLAPFCTEWILCDVLSLNRVSWIYGAFFSPRPWF